MNARNLEGFTIVHRLNLSAQNWRMFNGRENHALSAYIHPVQGSACAQFGQVIAGHSFPDVAPLILVFEPYVSFLGNGQFRRNRSELPVGEATPGCSLNYGVELRVTLGTRNVPLLSRGLNQHQSGRGAGLP